MLTGISEVERRDLSPDRVYRQLAVLAGFSGVLRGFRVQFGTLQYPTAPGLLEDLGLRFDPGDKFARRTLMNALQSSGPAMQTVLGMV